MALNKAAHEGFARFFEAPSRESLRDLLKNSIGETDQIDFKVELPEKTKLAKHLLGLANTGGGVLIIGVSEDDEPWAVGVSEIADKADIQKQLAPYLPSTLSYEVLDFEFRDSEYPSLKEKSFQVIVVESDSKELPYLCRKAGDGIKDNIVYVRKGTNTTEANHDDLQRTINERLETGFSSSSVLVLEEHLAQLKALYSEIPQMLTSMSAFKKLFEDPGGGITSMITRKPNPHYPKEAYDAFLARMIECKKSRIEKILDQ